MSKIKVVIMAGGVGERFWPKSRKSKPKQFLALAGESSMLQATVERLMPLVKISDIYIATGEVYKELVSEQLPELPVENIIIEPCGRNTAACIGLAAVHIQKSSPDSVMIVLPSDHVILNEQLFIETLRLATEVSMSGEKIVTLGITPTQPEVGYGYIKYIKDENSNIYEVDMFVEKPDRKTAEEYLQDGSYLWNSGMFIWKTSTILNNIKKLMPDHFKLLSEIGSVIGEPNYTEFLDEKYPLMDKISVDYGILEHADDIYVIPGNFGWDDVGSWNSIERLNRLDENRNVLKGDVKTIDVVNCTVDSSNRLIALIGLEDLVIVDTEDTLLICHKDKTNQIKEVLTELKKTKDVRL